MDVGRYIEVVTTRNGPMLEVRFGGLRTIFGFQFGILPVQAVNSFLDKWEEP
jgi:hypothetical protein